MPMDPDHASEHSSVPESCPACLGNLGKQPKSCLLLCSVTRSPNQPMAGGRRPLFVSPSDGRLQPPAALTDFPSFRRDAPCSHPGERQGVPRGPSELPPHPAGGSPVGPSEALALPLLAPYCGASP
ncbi:unnamed protein product [Arctogadus glacialis]